MHQWLDSTSDAPPYRQIADAIYSEVSVGLLGPGVPLPATRLAAAEIGVHRHTVARAYRELCDAGILTRGTRGKVHVATAAPASAVPSDADMQMFADDVLKRAAAATISPEALIESIRRRIDTRAHTVTIVECTEDQCADLAEQIARRWQVDVTTVCLETSAASDALPEGTVLSTLAHINDIRKRWPEHVDDVRFLSICLSPAMTPILQHLVGQTAAGAIRIVVEHDLKGGDAIAAIVSAACDIAPDRFEVMLVAECTAASTAANENVVVATPHAFRLLPASMKSSPWTVRIRYAFDPSEVEALAAAQGWKRNASSPESATRLPDAIAHRPSIAGA